MPCLLGGVGAALLARGPLAVANRVLACIAVAFRGAAMTALYVAVLLWDLAARCAAVGLCVLLVAHGLPACAVAFACFDALALAEFALCGIPTFVVVRSAGRVLFAGAGTVHRSAGRWGGAGCASARRRATVDGAPFGASRWVLTAGIRVAFVHNAPFCVRCEHGIKAHQV